MTIHGRGREQVPPMALKSIRKFLANPVHAPLIAAASVMKRVEVILKPFKFEDVREALSEIGIAGMTVTQVRGFGRQQGHTEVYRGSEYQADFVPKTKLEILADDEKVPEIIQAVTDAAWTGKIGDGKIFISDVENVIRVRTGETGSDAL